jgi:Zn-dependent protease
MALRYGDKTALFAGRLTLNPFKHLDPFGSVILPALLYITTGFAFGWARPVPYNQDNLSDRKWGTFFVASAGVLANFFIAIVFGLILRFAPLVGAPAGIYFILSTIVIINLALGIFNLVPIPPLDGSKILFSLLPWRYHSFLQIIEQYSLILLIAFVFFFSDMLYPILAFLFNLLTGFYL